MEFDIKVLLTILNSGRRSRGPSGLGKLLETYKQ